ncbi:cell division protein ZapA [Malonomonas rubra]|uniref:cell division protein ZapA n=1 Tax=Malonomonas rubra TaxID=57040 RepID=UPI0026F059BC|nr:cell division protein ZapA [Malonomonas rubra]
MSQTIQVQILGRDYSLRSHQSEQQVQRVANFVCQMLEETAAGRTVDTRDLTVLTLLNLAGKYLQLVDGQVQQKQNDSRIRELVEQLERSVSGC